MELSKVNVAALKSTLLVLVGLGIGILVGWWAGHPSAAAAVQPQITAPSPQPNANVSAISLPAPSVHISDGSNVIDWEMIHADRDRALQNNPDLKKEHDALLEEMKQQQQQMNTAMIKVDPRVASILKKIDDPTNGMVSGDEWQKLNAAKQPAIKTNPALAAKAQELSAKITAFQKN